MAVVFSGAGEKYHHMLIHFGLVHFKCRVMCLHSSTGEEVECLNQLLFVLQAHPATEANVSLCLAALLPTFHWPEAACLLLFDLS